MFRASISRLPMSSPPDAQQMDPVDSKQMSRGPHLQRIPSVTQTTLPAPPRTSGWKSVSWLHLAVKLKQLWRGAMPGPDFYCKKNSFPTHLILFLVGFWLWYLPIEGILAFQWFNKLRICGKRALSSIYSHIFRRCNHVQIETNLCFGSMNLSSCLSFLKP